MEKLFYHLPGLFIERLKTIYPTQYIQILRTFLERKISTFRINTIKTTTEHCMELLQANSVLAEKVSWYHDAFILKKPSQRDFQELQFYKDGFVYFQNLSSMLPVLLLRPLPGEKILDLCAAPGGKTSQIAACIQNQGEIIACEKIKIRLYKLLANLKILGIEHIKTLLWDGSFIWKKYENYFDKVLLDAPCTSESQFLIHFPKTYSYWSERKIHEAQHKQKRLLYSAIKSLKPGGRCVYSTCTFAPEENEAVIAWAIEQFQDLIVLEKINLPFKNYQSGIRRWQGENFPEQLQYTQRIIPSETMEGFFLASLKKIKA